MITKEEIDKLLQDGKRPEFIFREGCVNDSFLDYFREIVGVKDQNSLNKALYQFMVILFQHKDCISKPANENELVEEKITEEKKVSS